MVPQELAPRIVATPGRLLAGTEITLRLLFTVDDFSLHHQVLASFEALV